MKLSIIIPAYNESRTLGIVIEKIESVTLLKEMDYEIIIVDDGSVDETSKILEEYKNLPNIRIFKNKANMGKASAVKRGIQESEGDIVIIQDADLEYNPEDYPALLDPIIKGNHSIVYGSRFKGWIKKMRFLNRISNIFSNITLNLLFFVNLTDVNTGYKVFRKNALKNISLESTNFMLETELTAKLLRNGFKIVEVPINYTARTRQEGKKMTTLKAIEMYCGLIKYRFRSAN